MSIFYKQSLTDALNKLKFGQLEESRRILENHIKDIQKAEKEEDKTFDHLIAYVRCLIDNIESVRQELEWTPSPTGSPLNNFLLLLGMKIPFQKRDIEKMYNKIINCAHHLRQIVIQADKKTK